MNSLAIIRALEDTATNRADDTFVKRANANKADITHHRRTIMRFLEAVDGDLTVDEIMAVLTEIDE